MLLGFVHGVMNTDNTSIAGETIDFGPCAFLEAYDPAMVFSSIDAQGRYAYQNQPGIALWNLTRLAESLLPILVEEEGSESGGLERAKDLLGTFAGQYHIAYQSGMRRKLGLTMEQDSDAALAADLLELMAANDADFTLTFRRLCDAAEDEEGVEGMHSLFQDTEPLDRWLGAWKLRFHCETREPKQRAAQMRLANPIYIPRNHLVEEVIDAAVEADDFGPFNRLLDCVTRPYEEGDGLSKYAVPARPEELVRATFCGT
jgi:uncharacterized protein YdiU (UPF0061 family)